VIQADAGFRAEGVLTASLPLPQTRFPDHAQRAEFAGRLLENLKAVPGVRVASTTLPLLGGWQSSFSVEGKPEPAPGQRPSADIARVGPDYFQAMGVRLLEGRAFGDCRPDRPPAVCMVDETLARKHWPGRRRSAKRLKFGGLDDKENPWMELVASWPHVKNYGVDEDSRAEMYPLPPELGRQPHRGRAHRPGPREPVAGSREAVRAADPELPVYSVRTLDSMVAAQAAPRRLAALLIGVFAVSPCCWRRWALRGAPSATRIRSPGALRTA